MRVAVLSLTRDRLAYSKHCFARLRELAGCRFDHYILDQGSQDGSQEWLRNEYAPHWLELLPENIGISRGINRLIEQANPENYDVIVKFDNDCELVTENVLRDCAVLAADYPDWAFSPKVEGLRSPPGVVREIDVDGFRVGVPVQLGGIFLALGADTYTNYRHSEANPTWGMDDVNLCAYLQERGGELCYLLDHVANHYETTDGQWARYPGYFAQKQREGLPV